MLDETLWRPNKDAMRQGAIRFMGGDRGVGVPRAVSEYTKCLCQGEIVSIETVIALSVCKQGKGRSQASLHSIVVFLSGTVNSGRQPIPSYVSSIVVCFVGRP